MNDKSEATAEDTAILEGLTHEVSRKDVRDIDVQTDQLVQRMAALTVRRYANQHGCTGSDKKPCDHPQHQSDVQALRDVLEILGLPGTYDPPTVEQRENLLAHIPESIQMGNNKKPGDTMIDRPRRAKK